MKIQIRIYDPVEGLIFQHEYEVHHHEYGYRILDIDKELPAVKNGQTMSFHYKGLHNYV